MCEDTKTASGIITTAKQHVIFGSPPLVINTVVNDRFRGAGMLTRAGLL